MCIKDEAGGGEREGQCGEKPHLGALEEGKEWQCGWSTELEKECIT